MVPLHHYTCLHPEVSTTAVKRALFLFACPGLDPRREPAAVRCHAANHHALHNLEVVRVLPNASESDTVTAVEDEVFDEDARLVRLHRNAVIATVDLPSPIHNQLWE